MEVNGTEDGEDEFGNLSPAELIAMLKKHNISPSGAVGSPPNIKRSGFGHGTEVKIPIALLPIRH